ncbi:hypothetical protein [Nonomuraea sp. NPDC049784]|uniref:hypothetical protein n=1 Tax=Nonomuraea sp. NPDC049784 TaxID=3154361 RepID=UPI0033D2267B
MATERATSDRSRLVRRVTGFRRTAATMPRIAHKHTEQIQRIRERMVAGIGDSTDLRDWVACLVRPLTEHLESLGSPTWYARFTAQIMADPSLNEIMIEEALTIAPTLREFQEG